ncbi:MAG: TorD/DmsD family molecular chaperone [Planctomycetota bacterium]|jgi:TorA maturation chaperone TorD
MKNTAIEVEPVNPEAALALGRSRMYRFLASCFLEKPTQEILDALKSGALLDEIGETFPSDGLRRFAQDPPSLEELIEESDALFRVPAGRYVTPYESVYRGQPRKDKKDRSGGCLMSEKTLEVIAWYKCTDHQIAEHCKELPDHVGCELDFLGRLCAEESEALETGDAELAAKWRNAQGGFLAEHLLAWFPKLAKQVHENDREGFYSGIVELAEHFLESEREDRVRFTEGEVTREEGVR